MRLREDRRNSGSGKNWWRVLGALPSRVSALATFSLLVTLLKIQILRREPLIHLA